MGIILSPKLHWECHYLQHDTVKTLDFNSPNGAWQDMGSAVTCSWHGSHQALWWTVSVKYHQNIYIKAGESSHLGQVLSKNQPFLNPLIFIFRYKIKKTTYKNTKQLNKILCQLTTYFFLNALLQLKLTKYNCDIKYALETSQAHSHVYKTS